MGVLLPVFIFPASVVIEGANADEEEVLVVLCGTNDG